MSDSIKVYKDLNSLYAEYQKGTSCHVFVDYPANVSKLRDAILRDKPKALAELNELYGSDELLDKLVTTRTEFKSYAEYQFATSIGVSANDLKKLKEHEADDEAGFATLVQEMQAAGYASSNKAADVLSYLRDRKEGGSPKGAVKVREARRVAQAQASKEAAERQRKLDTMRAKKSFRMGVVCIGMELISSAEIKIVLNLYASNAHVQSITSFISSSQTCMLRDAVLRGAQLTEISRQGRFVSLRSTASTEANALYGMLPSETWDSP